jgi:multimeric flavodoxin WrbA
MPAYRTARPPRVFAVDGSDRRDGVTDQLVEQVLAAAADAGANTERLHLIDQPIEY